MVSLRTGQYTRLLSLALAFALFLSAAALFIGRYVSAEDQAYIWDYGSWQHLFSVYGRSLFGGTGEWFYHLLITAYFANYNGSSLLLLLPFYGLFGDSRFVFVLALAGLYLFPACLLTANISARLLGSRQRWAPGWLLASALLYWPFWVPTLRGMPDVAGLIPLALATGLFLQPSLPANPPLSGGVRLGILIWLPFLLRRWYAYASIALLVSAGGYHLIAALARWKTDQARLWRLFGLALILGFTTAALLLLVQGGLVLRVLQTSYTQVYSAYSRSLTDQLEFFWSFSGLLLAGGVGLGLIRSVRQREWRVGVLFGAALLTFIFYTLWQAPEMQHMLPVFFWLFPCFIYGWSWPLSHPAAARGLWVLPLLLLAGFFSVFWPPARAVLQPAQLVLPAAHFPPLQLDNYTNYVRLASDIKDLAGSEERFAVFASSYKLAGELMVAVRPDLKPNIAFTGNIDLRDGMSLSSLQARYAVVTPEPVTQLSTGGQKIIEIPDQLIWHQEGMGTAYRQVRGPYLLADGIRAYLYERMRPLSEEDLADLQRRLYVFYPDWRGGRHGIAPPDAEGSNGLGMVP